jgi:hypothetical protein
MPSGLYYNPMTIVNDDYRVVTKLETSLTDDARVVIYSHHMFIVQATGVILTNSQEKQPNLKLKALPKPKGFLH